MQLLVIQRILGLLLSLFSLTFIPPAVIAWRMQDGEATSFALAFALTLLLGVLLWLPVRGIRRELHIRDGFVVVVLFWVALGLNGALPLLLSKYPVMSFTDAVFESVSGLTTTGATVLTGIDDLPASIKFYRQQLQWLGGMGIIVLAVAILPMLGIGGMQLYRAEIPGPFKDAKLTPRIAETAKALWYIYLGLTVLCATSYWLAGMTPFDAIAHSFSTVSIGGFSTHDASLGYFDSTPVEIVAIVFMLLSGMNFTLHFLAWRSLSTKPYWNDSEIRAYLFFLLTVSVIACAGLLFAGIYAHPGEAILDALFQTISVATTTGFTTAAFYSWPTFLPVLLIFASFIGGCACSTAGGIKVIRALLLYKQGVREILRLIHPSAVIPVKLGGKILPDRLVNAVWGFFAVYVAAFAVLMLALMATGLDQITAFSAMAACLNNLGPGLGEVSTHYGDINATAKWILTLAMVLGRLEIFTLLVLVTPAFWQK